MADVLLSKVRKNYNPAILKDTLRNINLDIKDGDFLFRADEGGLLYQKWVERKFIIHSTNNNTFVQEIILPFLS